MSFFEKFEDGLSVVAEWVDGNKYLSSIKNAFTSYVPFVIVGSFSTLLSTLVSSETTGLAQWIPELAALAPAFSALNWCTMSIMTLPIVFLIAMNMAKHNKTPEYITGALAVCAYVSMVSHTITLDGAEATASGLLVSAMSAQGLFVGMITAVLVSQLFMVLSHLDAIKIKMPPQVPAGITTSFNVLIPIFIVLIVTSLFGLGFQLATGTYINDWIYSVLQAPLESVVQTPAGIFILIIASQLFWFLGIHGGLVISPLRNPLLIAALAANVEAFEAGAVATNPITLGFWRHFIVLGGSGCILALVLALLLFSKREDQRAMARIGLVPCLCGISEPMVFGLPLVLNPTFMIPYIFNSCISCGIALFATSIGFMGCNVIDVPLIPVGIGAFVGWGWQGVVVQLICVVVCIFIWMPFVLLANRQAEREAKKNELEEAAAE